MSDKSPIPPGSRFLVYQTEDGKLKIDVRFQGETVWLSLNQLAELFQRDKSVISRHIKNVFDEGELRPEGTVAKSAIVQTEGSKHRKSKLCPVRFLLYGFKAPQGRSMVAVGFIPRIKMPPIHSSRT